MFASLDLYHFCVWEEERDNSFWYKGILFPGPVRPEIHQPGAQSQILEGGGGSNRRVKIDTWWWVVGPMQLRFEAVTTGKFKKTCFVLFLFICFCFLFVFRLLFVCVCVFFFCFCFFFLFFLFFCLFVCLFLFFFSTKTEISIGQPNWNFFFCYPGSFKSSSSPGCFPLERSSPTNS